MLHVILKTCLILSLWLHSWLSSETTLSPTCAPSQDLAMCEPLQVYSKLLTTAPAALFFLLSNLVLSMENSRQFYYFKSMQITQWLGEEYPALMLSTIFFQPPHSLPVVEGAGSRSWLLCLTHSKTWSNETSLSVCSFSSS